MLLPYALCGTNLLEHTSCRRAGHLQFLRSSTLRLCLLLFLLLRLLLLLQLLLLLLLLRLLRLLLRLL